MLTDDQAYLQLPAYAVLPTPKRSEGGDLGKTPRHNHYRHTYIHPYTKDIRPSGLDLWDVLLSWEPCGEVDLYDIEVEEVNHYITKGGFVNKNCFDELVHFTEEQFRFLMGWNRTAFPDQRTRVIAASNPPGSAEGYWIVHYWAPWLDPRHQNPARSGELRWFAQLPGRRGRLEDTEVDGPDPITIDGESEPIYPQSRTFIRAYVQDNPAYMESGYIKVLQALPEPLRSQMLHGDFGVGHSDHPRQVIPTAWVIAAQARWTQAPPDDAPIAALGVDVARGGKDNTVITPRHGTWFGEADLYPGTETPDGWDVVQYVIKAIPTGCRPSVNVDVIGTGASVFDLGRSQGLNIHAMDARRRSFARDASGQFGFANKKSEWWWLLREALDPTSGDDLALPPDRELLADLTAPRWEVTLQGIRVEDKDKLVARIGRSPDRGDSLVLAHAKASAPIQTHLL